MAGCPGLQLGSKHVLQHAKAPLHVHSWNARIAHRVMQHDRVHTASQCTEALWCWCQAAQPVQGPQSGGPQSGGEQGQQAAKTPLPAAPTPQPAAAAAEPGVSRRASLLGPSSGRGTPKASERATPFKVRRVPLHRRNGNNARSTRELAHRTEMTWNAFHEVSGLSSLSAPSSGKGSPIASHPTMPFAAGRLHT